MEWKQAYQNGDNVQIPNDWVFLLYYEAFNLLFRIENSLRVFVFLVLKDVFQGKWSEVIAVDGDNGGTLASIAKKRINQSRSFGYLGHSILCPIMHLNSGEMTRLITSETYWKHFKPYFLGSKEIIRSKLEEIGTIRNSLAHFRPVRADDVEVIKQNSKHVLTSIEKFLNQALVQTDVVPTNTADGWYSEFRTLGTELCTLTFHQSANEDWVRISVNYRCPEIARHHSVPGYLDLNVLTMSSSAVLNEYEEIRNQICYLTESIYYPRFDEQGQVVLGKTLALVISRKQLENGYSALKPNIEKLLADISTETELIRQDNLARGKLIHTTHVRGSSNTDENGTRWNWNINSLFTPISEDDPPEYWGKFSHYFWDDFIGAASEYPWMPSPVSKGDIPF